MSALRLFAMVLILAAVSAAWGILSLVTFARTEMLDSSLSDEMRSLWGPKVLRQAAPYWSRQTDGKRTDPGSVGAESSTVAADITHEHRYKGLLWYSTFAVDFTGEYAFAPSGAGEEARGTFVFRLPEGITSHDALRVTVDGQELAVPQDQKSSGWLSVPLDRDVQHVVAVSFTTYGQDEWLYVPGDGGQTTDRGEAAAAGRTMSVLKNFAMTVTTDFADINYPKGSRSPKRRAVRADGGMRAQWEHAGLVTSQAMGIAVPLRQNAGPIVTRMSLFAPVSLLFFFAVLFAVVVMKHIPLHPMHYLFISAGFFSCHILMAYLADLINIHAAFWIAAGVSVFLVISYMRLVAGVRFAVSYVGVAQMVYLVGFSYAFFWEGRTGLTVTVGAIVTLFLLMQATGKVNWQKAFRKGELEPPEANPPELTPPPPGERPLGDG